LAECCRFFERGTILAAGLIATGAAGYLLLGQLPDSPVLNLAVEIDRGRVVAPETLAAWVDDWTLRPVVRSCRRQGLVALGRVEAAVLEAVVRSGDLSRIGAAVDHLGTTARAILACSPGEGVAWAWLGLVRAERGASNAELITLFERSQKFAPADLWVLDLRLSALAGLRSRRGSAFDAILRRDIDGLFASPLSPWEIASRLGRVFPWVAPMTTEAFARVTDEQRREMLTQTFGYWGANVSGCASRNFIDWLFRNQVGSCNDINPLLDLRGISPQPRE
jgi:hypothetical protein